MKNRIERTGTDKNGVMHFYVLDDTDIPVDNSKRRQSIVNKVFSGLQEFLGKKASTNTSTNTLIDIPTDIPTNTLIESSAQPRLSVQRPNTGTKQNSRDLIPMSSLEEKGNAAFRREYINNTPEEDR